MRSSKGRGRELLARVSSTRRSSRDLPHAHPAPESPRPHTGRRAAATRRRRPSLFVVCYPSRIRHIIRRSFSFSDLVTLPRAAYAVEEAADRAVPTVSLSFATPLRAVKLGGLDSEVILAEDCVCGEGPEHARAAEVGGRAPGGACTRARRTQLAIRHIACKEAGDLLVEKAAALAGGGKQTSAGGAGMHVVLLARKLGRSL